MTLAIRATEVGALERNLSTERTARSLQTPHTQAGGQFSIDAAPRKSAPPIEVRGKPYIERFIGTLQRQLLDEEPVYIKLNGHPLDTVDRGREPHADPLHIGWLTKHSRFTHDIDHPGLSRVVKG